MGSRARIALVKQRLKIALDELDAYPYSARDVAEADRADDITDE